ncbi:Reverse transcriptase (RNA-dependent DNA polymerase) [Draconibacterium orientale]|uniref:Reverse transcriptase (RNA-dependent DNA polymerase) n=1 Tax=Draconibacterium orientale TaxID=1168034 RepID=A0A1I0FBB8_9BACT|nr:reverse transcriptase domain-containing protein [Draconibacterium orientale]SET55247.1 Reverse transcriptase (RNA-dependent DNA polymerase) [Draconibacterium orientale]
MAATKKKDWFKLKGYPHIGYPLNYSDRYKWIQRYITDPEKIASHSFLPFIHKTSKVRRFRKEYNEDTGELITKIVNGKHQNRDNSTKPRELYCASHIDSLIYSYYAFKLGKYYEEKVIELDIPDVATAYRTIPCTKETQLGKNKCNIDFANDVFEFISNFPQQEFVTITFDIKGFFDELNHKKLRENWIEVLNDHQLPPDHFNLYKNITRFAYVDLIDLFEAFKNQIITQKRTKDGFYGPIKKKRVSKIRFLRNQNAIAFCSKEDFLQRKGKLVKNKRYVKKDGKTITRNYGIPQGSPISSVLANIYMINFDKKINDFVKSVNGLYNRYSDDMVVVVPKAHKTRVIQLMKIAIDESDLQIQDEKTQIFHFKREKNRLVCGQEFNKVINWHKNLIYLGFEFDGETVLLKSASLSGYYRKMKRNINRSNFYVKHIRNNTRGILFKSRILKKFSYVGAKRRRIWKYNPNTNQYTKSDRYDWGNFLSYAYKASRVMMNNKIKKQTAGHWNKIHNLIKDI